MKIACPPKINTSLPRLPYPYLYVRLSITTATLQTVPSSLYLTGTHVAVELLNIQRNILELCVKNQCLIEFPALGLTSHKPQSMRLLRMLKAIKLVIWGVISSPLNWKKNY